MKFGQPEASQKQILDRSSFFLPPDHPLNHKVFSHYFSHEPAFLYLGAPGFDQPSWIGKIYERTSQNLYNYVLQFNALELNSTFYGVPSQKTIKSWKTTIDRALEVSQKFERHQTFKIICKVPKQISMQMHSGMVHSVYDEFCQQMELLQPHLGGAFLQFSEECSTKILRALKIFLGQKQQGLPLWVEFRHDSFFKNQTLKDEIFGYLAEQGVGVVMTDTVAKRSALHCSVTQSKALIRFLGNDLHTTDYTRIQDWMQKILKWLEFGINEVYFFIHQPDPALIPELALCFSKYLKSINNNQTPGQIFPLLGIDELKKIESLNSPQMDFFGSSF